VKRPVVLLAAAAACVIGGGWLLAATWHLGYGTGLYCSLGTASTVGCDPGLSAAGKIAAVVVILAAIPLFAAAFSELTSHLGARKVKAHLAEVEGSARAAHKIVADLFEHHTGEAHPLAPARKERM
jgi:hypothetical protein